MSDPELRELLELAAEAAGIDRGVDRIDAGISLTGADGRHFSLPRWNPLADDGDAFRLMCHLGIEMHWIAEAHVPHASAHRKRQPEASAIVGADEIPDKHAAARLAIVKVAAQIAKAKRAQGAV